MSQMFAFYKYIVQIKRISFIKIHNMKKARKTKTLDSQAEAIRKCERENIKIEVDIDRAIVGWSTLKIKISFDDLTGKLKSACDIRYVIPFFRRRTRRLHNSWTAV